MTTRYIFQQSKIPKLNSAFGKRLAKHLWDFKLWLADHRREREVYVRECDDAFLCRSRVPDVQGLDLLEMSEFGETDVKDNATIISIRLALTLMPRSNPWLQCGERENDDPKIIQACTDFNIYQHLKARTRRHMQRVFKQDFVRGSTYLHYDWVDKYRRRRLTNSENGLALEKFLAEQGLSKLDAKKFARGRENELIYSGLQVTPLDFYDVWVEPYVDITGPGEDPATIVQRFRHKARLLAEVDDNLKPVYENVQDIEPYCLEELVNNADFLGRRMASEGLMGNTPGTTYQSNVELIPVYIFHMPYFEFEGYEFWDTYFHLALSSEGDKPVLIKIEENPNDLGLNHLLMDHYEDWFTPTPYGLSPVQFMVSKLDQKNLMQMLTITGAAMGVIPPRLVFEAGLRDDEEISFLPGATIPVIESQAGMDVIKSLAMSPEGAKMGAEFLRFYADELKAQAGVDGLMTDNAARAMASRKTATEIDRDSTSGSFFLENSAENITEGMLNDLVQGGWQLMQANVKPSAENPNTTDYQKYLGDKLIEAQLSIKDLTAKRSIQVVGQAGAINKAQEVTSLVKYFEVLSRMTSPSAEPLKQWVAQQIAAKQGLILPDELRKTPQEIFIESPQIQIQAIQEGLKNPEVMAAAQQMVAQSMQPPPGAPQQGAPLPPAGAPQQ